MRPFAATLPEPDSRVPDAILARAEADPREFLSHVADHGGLFVVFCMSCKSHKAIDLGAPTVGLSDGLHEGCVAAYRREWMERG